MPLIYLSPVLWESFAQRPHKFVQWYHDRTGKTVLWVEPYATRLPQFKDLKRLHGSPDKCFSGKIPEWLKVLNINGIPVEPLPGISLINNFWWRKAKQDISEFANDSESLLVIGKPSAFALQLLSHLKPAYSVYDAMDNFPAFYQGLSRHALARKETLIAESVDLVTTSSTNLKDYWSRSCSDVRLVRNGLDISALQGIAGRPASLKKKIFGYVGTIAEWFDWEWIATLATFRPNDEIHLIGPCFIQPTINLPSNIILYSARDHHSALRAMMSFHVGLIPFIKTELTDSVDPIKYYEYRAHGLPVISTNFGEMRYRSDEDGVFISHKLDDVNYLAEEASNYRFEPGIAEEFAFQNTWKIRFDEAGLLN